MMKALSIFCVMMMLAVSGCNNDDDKVIEETSLPSQASQFIETHFPAVKISRVLRERDDNVTSYDVRLENLVELDFDEQGVCYSVDGNANDKIPDSVIPTKILEYVKTTYPTLHITDWEKNRTTQEVGLSDNKDLVFDLDGNFQRIDN